MSDKRFRDDDGNLDLGKIKRYEESSYKVFLLLKYIEEQQDTIQSLKEENDGIKTKGLDVLAFYESKLKNVVGTEDFQSVRDEIWIVRQVLYEMGVITDE